MQLNETLSVATYYKCEEQECAKEMFGKDCMILLFHIAGTSSKCLNYL